MERLKKSDKIFEDLLEDDFVKILRIGFSVQRVFGMLGVQLKYNFITPPTTSYKIYSVIVWTMNLICVAYTVGYCESKFDPVSIDIPLKIGIVVNGLTNAGLAWKSSFCSGQQKSQLYVKLQRIERILKMKNVKRLNKIVHVRSSSWGIITLVLYTLWLILFNKYLMKDFCPSASIATLASSASFVSIFHVSTILTIITMRVRYVKEALVRVNGQKEIVFSTTNAVVRNNVTLGKDLVHGMCCILDCFADTMDVFQHLILLFVFQMLVWQLLTMQNLVVTFKKQMSVNIMSFLCTVPCSTVFMGLTLALCFMSRALTSGLEECGELCTSIISTLDEGESRDNAKRISILLKGRRQATVFDIFTLNTQLPFNLLAVTASYTIVLLQFATL